MSDEKKGQTPERVLQSTTKTRVVNLSLGKLSNPAKDPGNHAHRSDDKYQPANLEDLSESIKCHGLLDPPLVAKRSDGRYEIVSGHRRVASLFVLAGRSLPGFGAEMQVQCLEVLEASPLELMTRSITGNELGKKLDVKERLLAVKKAATLGATKKELAAMVGMSEKSIERDLSIVRHPRALQHVMDDNLAPTTAGALVEVAASKGRLDEFLDYFDGFVSRMKQKIEDEDSRAKQERGKGLKPQQMLVMNNVEPHIVRGWLDALAKGKPLTEGKDLGFEASFDKDSAIATIKVKVDARRDPPERLARVAGQVSQVAKHIAAFAQTRKQLEGPEGPQAALQQDDDFIDRELLHAFGLDDVMDETDSTEPAEANDGE